MIPSPFLGSAIRKVTLGLVVIGAVVALTYGAQHTTFAGAGNKMLAAIQGAITTRVARSVSPSGVSSAELAPYQNSGTLKFFVTKLKFDDTPISTPDSPELTSAEIQEALNKTKQYYLDVSNGKLQFDFDYTSLPTLDVGMDLLDPIARGDNPLDLYVPVGTITSNPASIGGMLDNMLCNIRTAAHPNGIDLSQYYGVITISDEPSARRYAIQNKMARDLGRSSVGYYLGSANGKSTNLVDCAERTKANNKFLVHFMASYDRDLDSQISDRSSWLSDIVLRHEMGHAIGFGHARTQDREYGNDYDLMGNARTGLQLGAPFLSLANWLNVGEKKLVMSSSPQVIAPLEVPGAYRAIELAGRVFAEFRVPMGYDLPPSGVAFWQPGVLITRILPKESDSLMVPTNVEKKYGQQLLGAGGCLVIPSGSDNILVSVPKNGITYNAASPALSLAHIDVSYANDNSSTCADLEVRSVTTDHNLVLNDPNSIDISIYNNGNIATKRVDISLSITTNEYAARAGDPSSTIGRVFKKKVSVNAIPPHSERMIKIPWTPDQFGLATAHATILTNDAYPENNEGESSCVVHSGNSPIQKNTHIRIVTF